MEAIALCTKRLAEHTGAVELRKVYVWMLTYEETRNFLYINHGC